MESSAGGLNAHGNFLALEAEFAGGREGLSHARLNEAEADGVDVDVIAAPFLGEGFGEADDTGFA